MKKVFWRISIFAMVFVLAGCVTEMITAARKGDVATMQRLLDQGADINETGGKDLWSVPMDGPPLSHAAYFCQPKAVRFLVSKGADVDAYTPGHGSFKWRPLHYAACADCLDVVQILLDAGADINARADGDYGSPLTVAAKYGNVRTIKYLIARGGDVDYAIGVLSGSSGTHFGKLKPAQAISLLEKYSRPMAAADPRLKASAEPLIRSDVDAIPDLKAAPRSDAYAVVIGIENYQGLPKSDYSRKDAETMKGYLTALGFQERNIEMIVDERATKSAVEKAVEAWLPNQTTNDSTVFVYFSGHGAPEPATGESYIVPYDGDPNYLAVTGYPLKRLYERLGRVKAREIIVVLDSCFSGSGGRSVLAKGARPLVMVAATEKLPPAMAVMTASQGSQISTSYAEKGHGVFTYYFLKAIKEGKTDLARIYEAIKPQVEDAARRLNVRQSPGIRPDVENLKGRFNVRNEHF